MILYDPSINVNYRDYGIMLPIPPDRGRRVLDFLGSAYNVIDIASAKVKLGPEEQVFKRGDLERIHSKDYIADLYGDGLKAALLKAFELIDAQGKPCRYEPDRAIKPLSDMFGSLIAQTEGTYLACLLAQETSLQDARDTSLQDVSPHSGFCFYLGGGMHHARYDTGSGFCLINDVAAAAFKVLARETSLQDMRKTSLQDARKISLKKTEMPNSYSDSGFLIWIIDLDAHKGDGTAELVSFARERGELQIPYAENFAAKSNKNEQIVSPNSKPSVLTLSIHMAKGWPLDEESVLSAEKGRAPLLPSDVDIGIDSGDEADYTIRLKEGIRKLESMSRKAPDLALVVDGADPYEHDALDSSSLLRLTLEQCIERDVYVYRYLKDRHIPSAWIQAGGYGDRAWEPPAYFLRRISENNFFNSNPQR